MERGCVDGRALVAHGAGIVDENAHRHGLILLLKRIDGLRNVIFPYPKILLRQTRHRVAFVVDDGAVEQHLIHVGVQNVHSVLPLLRFQGIGVGRFGRLGRGCFLRVDGGNGIAIDIERRLRFRRGGIVHARPGRTGASLPAPAQSPRSKSTQMLRSTEPTKAA